MAKTSKKKKKSGGGEALYYIFGSLLIVFVLAAFAGLGLLYWKATSNGVNDKVTLCPEAGPTAVTAFLIDTTDPLSDTTMLALKNRFSQASLNIPVGSMLEIYGLTPQRGKLIKAFARCNPGDGGSVDEWTNNPKHRQKLWEESFKQTLDKVAEDLANGAKGDESPIMAGIQQLKLQVFDQYGAIPKKLIVASDLIENTPLYSQYKSGADFATFKKSAAFRDFATTLDGIQTSFWYVRRANFKTAYAAHGEFWANYVAGFNGHFESIEPLEGMN